MVTSDHARTRLVHIRVYVRGGDHELPSSCLMVPCIELLLYGATVVTGDK